MDVHVEDEVSSDQDGNDARKGKAQADFPFITTCFNKGPASYGHQGRSGTHHDGKGDEGIEAQHENHDHTRRIEATAQGHQGTENAVQDDGQHQLAARQADGGIPGSQPFDEPSLLAEHQQGRYQESQAQIELYFLFRQLRYQSAADDGTDDSGKDEGKQRQRLDFDMLDENMGLQDDGNRKGHIQRPRQEPVLPQLAGRIQQHRRRGETADAEDVERVGNEADEQVDTDMVLELEYDIETYVDGLQEWVTV